MSEPTGSPWRFLDPTPLRQGLALVWRSAPGWTAVQGVLLVLQGLLPLAGLYLLKLIVDTVSAVVDGGAADGGRLTLLVVLAGAVAAATAALRTLGTWVSEVQALRLVDEVLDVLHTQSMAIDLAHYESPTWHDTFQRTQERAPTRPARIVHEVAQIGRGGLSLLAILGLLLAFEWWLVALLLVAALPGLAIRTIHSWRHFQWARDRTPLQRFAMYLTRLMTTATAAKEIRLLGLASALRARHRAVRDQVIHERMQLVRRRTVADLATQAFAVLAVFVSFWVVARSALAGTITVGDMVMYLGAFQRAQDYFRDVLAGVAGLYDDNLFLTDFRAFTSLQPTVTDPPVPAEVPRPVRHHLACEGVTFAYPGTDRTVLHDIHCEIRPGEHVALVGENGSGKTTLVKLLCRLYDPTSGTIQLGGVDLRGWRVDALRRELTVVFQDFARFQLTARENLWLGNVDLPPDSARFEEAARRTGVHELLARLPEGYETRLGREFAGGVELSLGEWQKIALARAFARDAGVLILDEPTASLDPRAEAAVFDHFNALAAGRTTLVISHRLSTVRNVDRILVMAEGRIVESGPHDELMARDGVYAQLFETQARHYR